MKNNPSENKYIQMVEVASPEIVGMESDIPGVSQAELTAYLMRMNLPAKVVYVKSKFAEATKGKDYTFNLTQLVALNKGVRRTTMENMRFEESFDKLKDENKPFDGESVINGNPHLSTEYSTYKDVMTDFAPKFLLVANEKIKKVFKNILTGAGRVNNEFKTKLARDIVSAAVLSLIDDELITYASKNSTQFLTCGRGAEGTTAASHLDNTIVYDSATFVGWGEASQVQTAIRLDPANWSLDNFGQILIATMHNGPTFTWDPSAADALNTRAVINASMPQTSVMTIVSDRDRHLIHLGTNETLPNGTQDKMLIRFSDQENYNDYAPTSTNTAGTFRLDAGTKIVAAVRAKDYILILTDDAAYSMQFVGPPFTFSIRKVGSNCGCLGQHAVVFAQGIVFWMGDSGGFFAFDGTVVSVPSLVEDFVFTTGSDNLGINYDASETVFAAHNSLFQEIMWFYTKANSTEIDRVVTYNYGEKVWTTGTMSSATVGSQSRTTWADASVYDHPHATKYVAAATPTFPIVNGVSAGASVYYEHEIGVNEVATTGVETAIPANIRSGDFDLDIDGDGEYFLSVKRFIPDFKTLDGDCKVTLFLRSYPADTTVAQGETFIGPFTVNSSTDKIDTRGRARLASIKIENDAVNTNWRYGIFRVDIQPDGRR